MDTPLLSRGAIFPLHHRRVRARCFALPVICAKPRFIDTSSDRELFCCFAALAYVLPHTARNPNENREDFFSEEDATSTYELIWNRNLGNAELAEKFYAEHSRYRYASTRLHTRFSHFAPARQRAYKYYAIQQQRRAARLSIVYPLFYRRRVIRISTR